MIDRMEAEVELQRQYWRSKLFAEIALKIHQSSRVDTILQTMVTEVQRMLQCDRVLVYQFDAQRQGSFVVEATGNGPYSLLGKTVSDPCFTTHYHQKYLEGRTSAIDDVETARISVCHRQLLRQFGVQANLVVPILQPVIEPDRSQNRLWGLLLAHHCQGPRQWQPFEQDLLQQIAVQAGVALGQSQLVSALRESEARYALAVRGANDGLWDWDFLTNRVYFSPRWKALLGYRDSEVGDQPQEWLDRVYVDDQAQLRAELDAHLQGRSDHFESEHRIRHADGSVRWVLCRGLAIRDGRGHVLRMAGSLADIHERKLVESRLLHDALHDALTGLPNRALFIDRLGQTMAIARRQRNHHFAVLFLDLDRFKVVNDSLGHLCGDRLLVELANRLRTCVRPQDTVARLGGDEFAILLTDLDQPEIATRAAERVQLALKAPFDVDGHEFTITTSIGIAFGTPEYARPGDVLRDADLAMYRAKELGRNCYAAFDRSFRERVIAQLHLERDLRRAMERQEFFLTYQPIVDLATGRVASLEALVRWHHPDRGLVSPAEFIPMAEETGTIIPLGEWILREACQQMMVWLQAIPSLRSAHGWAGLSVSVNLSARQFTQPNLAQSIEGIVAETGLPPQHLKLEITESVVMADAKTAEALLRKLRDRGIQLSIDDFGTGYSSLSYLQRFPIDTIKIDRSFVTRSPDQESNWAIVRAIIALAESLGMDTVAEGIETIEQLRQLQSMDCSYGQGYWFSRPIDGEATGQLLLKTFELPRSPLALRGDDR
ncbi:EAL domain-containing protein [Limnothrix sp. FACHB-881]|uniref:putative bifunctional diguanylate cyclase/phosphodiesterase n=2 Tax=Limnothrix TaxID=132605 RepID=UPI001687C225